MEKGTKAFRIILEDLEKWLSTGLKRKKKLNLKSPRIVAKETPHVGDVVQLKEDLPQGLWKLGKIIELFISNDGNVRVTKVFLPTINVVNCPLNLLYPLECEPEHNDQIRETTTNEPNSTNVKGNKNNEEQDHGLEEKIETNEKDQNSRNIRKTKQKKTQEARDKILRKHLIELFLMVGMSRMRECKTGQ